MGYASRWARFLASVIDVVVIIPLTAFLGVGLIEQVSDFQPNFQTVIVVWTFVYYVAMTSAFGATLGKVALGMRVADADGSRPGVGAVVMREVVGKILSALVIFIGFFWILVDDRRQGWHDKIGKTFVVKAR